MPVKQPAIQWKTDSSWMEWVGVGTLLVVTVFAFGSYQILDLRRWPVLGLLLLSTGLQIWPRERYPVTDWRNQQLEHGRLLALTLLSLLMAWLGINYTALIILYFVFSGRALYIFPTHIGYSWILSWGGVTTAALLWGLWPDWSSSLLSGLGATCGFLFVGSAANAQRRAEEMAAQLRVAHQQLKQYMANAEELAIAEERNRMAREMHDTLGHRLTVAAVQLEGAQKLILRNPEKAAQMVGTVREQVLEGLTDLRRTVAALRTPVLEELPLQTALSRLVVNFVDATGLAVELTLPDEIPPLAAPLRQTIYRTAQEALTNIQRHAQATRVTVVLSLATNGATEKWAADTESGKLRGDSIQIAIEDDGVGFSESELMQGFGLRGLAERAKALSGQFSSDQGDTLGGASLKMCLPLAVSANNQLP